MLEKIETPIDDLYGESAKLYSRKPLIHDELGEFENSGNGFNKTAAVLEPFIFQKNPWDPALRLNNICRTVERIILFLMCSVIWIVSHSSASDMVISAFDDTGTPLQNVTVLIKNKMNVVKIRRITDDKGKVLVPFLEPGEYKFLFIRNGFTTIQTPELKIHWENIFEIKAFLSPEVDNIEIRKRLGRDVEVEERRITSIRYIASPDTLMPGENKMKCVLAHIPQISLDEEGRKPFFRGARTSDGIVFLDGISMTDPMGGGPFMLPPAPFIDEVEFGSAGFPAYMDISFGGFFELFSRRWNNKNGFHFYLDGEYEYADTFLNSKEADDAFDYWEQKYSSDQAFKPDRNPKNGGREGNIGIQWNGDRHAAFLAGQWYRYDHDIQTDFVSHGACEKYDVWFKYKYEYNKKGVFKLLAGAEDQWNRPGNFYGLRGMGPVFDHRKKHLLAMEWIRSIGSDYRLKIQLLHKLSDSRSGPPQNRSSFKSPEENDTNTSINGYPDTRLFCDGTYSEDRLSGILDMPGQVHNISMGGNLWTYQADWEETAWLDEKDIGFLSWTMNDREWFLSLWGRDRWFPTSRLEIMIALKWNRLNYLSKPDYVSPRLQVDYRRFGLDFYGGMERIVHSQGLTALSSRISSDTGAMAKDIENIPPDLGFRWFSGIAWNGGHHLRVDLNAYMVLLTQAVDLLSEKRGNIRVYYPIIKDGGHKNGASMILDYLPLPTLKLSLFYRWNHSALTFWNNSKGQRIYIDADAHFPNYQPEISPGDTLRLEDDSEHVAGLNCDYTCKTLADTRFRLDFVYRSGIPFFSKQTTSIPESVEPIWRQSTGDGSLNTSLWISKTMNVNRKLKLTASVSARNIFNTFQDPQTNPVTGYKAFDPYSLRTGSARSFQAQIGIQF